MVSGNNHCVMSIDVEDWFHILDLPSTPGLDQWDRLPSRVERNFMRLLDLAAESRVRCTCFFLGWIAERHPRLVTAAVGRGHEIASHGWAHRLAYELTPREFYEDAAKAKDVLEQISGHRVLGYRSAGFSLSDRNAWVFDELLRAGYSYDASVFPARRAHGGWRNGQYSPYIVKRPNGELVEFPTSVEEVFGNPYCFFGGGYLRAVPACSHPKNDGKRAASWETGHLLRSSKRDRSPSPSPENECVAVLQELRESWHHRKQAAAAAGRI